MNRLQSKMTTAELAGCLGVASQTVNRWTREQNWSTEPIPGVKGGRARVICIDQDVKKFLANTNAFRKQNQYNQAAEPRLEYVSRPSNPALSQIHTALDNMTQDEQQQLAQLLVQEGVSGLLLRLGIRNQTDE
jgi:hypothetical protein